MTTQTHPVEQVSERAREAAESVFDDVLGDMHSYGEFMRPSHREGAVRTLADAFALFERDILAATTLAALSNNGGSDAAG